MDEKLVSITFRNEELLADLLLLRSRFLFDDGAHRAKIAIRPSQQNLKKRKGDAKFEAA